MDEVQLLTGNLPNMAFTYGDQIAEYIKAHSVTCAADTELGVR